MPHGSGLGEALWPFVVPLPLETVMLEVDVVKYEPRERGFGILEELLTMGKPRKGRVGWQRGGEERHVMNEGRLLIKEREGLRISNVPSMSY